MKKLFLYIPVMILLAVSCEKEDMLPSLEGNVPASQVEMVTETISGSLGIATKSTISDVDASFAWTEGDNVAVHISNGNYSFTTDGAAIDAVESSKASFTVAYEAGYSRNAFAVYPCTIVAKNAANYGQEDHTLDVTLPDSYTLAQVSGETSPCPMISTDEAGTSWNFFQLCGLMRLTVGSVPATAKRLEFDFNGKKVCGDFSIASPVVPGTSAIETSADDAHDVITITKDGSDAVFGVTSLTLNIPMPIPTLNEGYSKVTVYAYDAVSGGNLLSFSDVAFSYSANEIRAYKRAASLPDKSTYTFTFKDKDTQSNLSGLRFVRIFSTKNKLYNAATTFGPYTVSSANETADMDNPVKPALRFAANEGDQLVFQVIDASGKVYSGFYDVPAGCSAAGDYDLTVDVKAYTFTVASGKKVYFSPGDLGVDGSVYSFTMPFETWGWKSTNINATKRVWFNYSELSSGHSIYGVTWRNPQALTTSTSSPTPQEWDRIIGRTNMNSGVSAYYRATVSGKANCLLLPPDEAQATDIEDDLKTGNVTDYAKYLGKGFVLLIGTGRALYSSNKLSWGMESKGFYWALWNNMSRNRTYFYWSDSNTPSVTWASNQFRMRVRYVRDVE